MPAIRRKRSSAGSRSSVSTNGDDVGTSSFSKTGLPSPTQSRPPSPFALPASHRAEIPSAPVSTQRRRVNPESLAARLGPEVVAELEKHIEPGNIEMPSFAVRRAVQVKFSIDRRHIYDFYHSKGLRCLKDEKRGRLVRNAIPTPPTSPKPYPQKRRRAAAVLAEAVLIKPPRPTRAQIGIMRSVQPALSPSPSSSSSSSDSSSDSDSDDSVEPMETEKSTKTTDSLSRKETPSPPDPATILAWKSFADSLYPCDKSAHDLWLDTVSSLCDRPDLDLDQLWDPYTFHPEFDTPSLSQDDRKGTYQWFDRVIGPARGVQESVGSYHAYMERQRHSYLDSFFSEAPRPSLAHLRTPSVEPFRGWIKSSGSFVPQRLVPSPSPATRHESRLASRQSGASTGSLNVPTSISSMHHSLSYPLINLPEDDAMRMEGPVTQLTSWSILPVQADAGSAPNKNLAMGSTIGVAGAPGSIYPFGKVEGHGRDSEVMGGREPLLPMKPFNRGRTYSANGYF
ncbi:uncharacterized protein STEHIDRAFT_151699 [Stereum hirsutum FP-91666 SS1]|uniref:uncharacterized protein n=1 Tax=Stereum hirsutum (strain FP-91666) TaxID=721885 RepID=UPI000440A0B0|nr:uncharacterized protein STEHIDRAFT_151699 [Stereum hirsutum FP-91666 SS1]EIM92369.1 hypothetical protein STEHIDRAFT_151699 [Stereum hirsutum FP-91666 SS1]